MTVDMHAAWDLLQNKPLPDENFLTGKRVNYYDTVFVALTVYGVARYLKSRTSTPPTLFTQIFLKMFLHRHWLHDLN